jgi:hypothetical protein
MQPVPLHMLGFTFPSIAAGARAFGCTRAAIHRALNDGREIGGRPGARGVKCYVAGKQYPSVKAAAEALGVTSAAISRRRARMRAKA